MKKHVSGPPTFMPEQELWSCGFNRVGGIDEAGRGPLAGPVIAAVVIINPLNYPDGLNDSKKLSCKAKERLFDEIMATSEVSVGIATHEQIDRINIRQATFLAMRSAALGLAVPADAFIVDGNAVPPGLGKPATALISGDALSRSVAAASIIAKVTRDRMMADYAVQYPVYGFEDHMGYPTKSHVAAIEYHGPCAIHRMTFAPIKNLGSVPKLASARRATVA